MKLLICAPEYYPHGSGIANVAYSLVEQFKKKGICCTVCSPTGPDIIVGNFKLTQKYGIFGLIHYWYKVSKHFKNTADSFDVVWCHNPLFFKNNPFNHCLMTMNSTYYGKVIHGKFPWHLQTYYIFSSLLEKYSLVNLKSDVQFTGVGQNVCNELESIGINKKRIKYIPNGVDVELFKPHSEKIELRNIFGIPVHNQVLLYVGRLSEVKQPLLLVEVFSIIEENIKNISLVIGGDGELLDKTKELAKTKKLKNVIFLGHVDNRKDLSSLYACSDYFIITSKYEGGEPPLTLSEAMSSNLPCIVSNIPNFHLIQKADCGIIVDFSDIQAASKQIIEYILKNDSQHSKKARDFILKNLDWDILSKIYIDKLNML